MSLFLDYKIQNPSGLPIDSISVYTSLVWHRRLPLLATASHGGDLGGGIVLVVDDLGETIPDVAWPKNPAAQSTSLAWHPTRKLLVLGWENGEISTWAGERDLTSVQSPHQGPITILQWSDHGGRMVSADAMGSCVAWKVDPRGNLLIVFHHDISDSITEITFRRKMSPRMGGSSGEDLPGLARAAVEGDAKALDLFTNWRPRTAGPGARTSGSGPGNELLDFYLGTAMGGIYHVATDGNCTQVMTTEGSFIRQILMRPTLHNAGQILVLTDKLHVCQMEAIDDSGTNLREITKVKLTGRVQDAWMCWCGEDRLAVCTGEIVLRVWHLDSGENYVLEPIKISSLPGAATPSETLTHIAYNEKSRILCAGTNLGGIAMWRHSGRADSEVGNIAGAELDAQWTRLPGCHVRGAVKYITWAFADDRILAVNTISSVHLLKAQEPLSFYCGGVGAVQISASKIAVECLKNSKRVYVDFSEPQVLGLTISTSGEHLAVWGPRSMTIYQVVGANSTGAVSLGPFNIRAQACVLHESSAVVLETGNPSIVQIRTFQGTIKQRLGPGIDSESAEPMYISSNGPWLVISDTSGTIRVWDLSRREARPHGRAIAQLSDRVNDFGEVIQAKINATGSRVSITVANTVFRPDPKLYIWDVESDIIHEILLPEERYLINHFWDPEEPTLIQIQASDTSGDNSLITAFSTKEDPFLIHADKSLTSLNSRLLGLQAPIYILLSINEVDFEDDVVSPLQNEDSNNRLVLAFPVKHFEGLQDCDSTTRRAVLDFSYELAAGRLRDAFKAIQMVSSPAVWRSLARVCVTSETGEATDRLAVARACLSRLREARLAMSVRRAVSSESEPEAQLGVLAVQLDMPEEARCLFQQAGRWDLVCRLLQSQDKWEEAVEVAEAEDRIGAKAALHSWARHLEACGDTLAATRLYERAGTHRTHVPRMLLDEPAVLEQYVSQHRDPALLRWWGRYMEAEGRLDEAVDAYRQAGDHYSLVRIFCYEERLDQAAEVATNTRDPVACFHLARAYETAGQLAEAVSYFGKAGAYGNAVRLCREHGGLDDQLWALALQASPREQLEAAKHLESTRPERSVELYRRAGYSHRAIEVALQTGNADALGDAAAELGAAADPDLLKKSARALVESRRPEKAVVLLAGASQFEAALDLIEEQNVGLTEALAEQLTPAQPSTDSDKDHKIETEYRAQILGRLGQIAQAQGLYLLSARKFAQASRRIDAMKSLLRSGDTDKIIQFANVSRQKEIYILAANYLQTLDWRARPDALQTIIQFYTRARATEQLANFYVTCAHYEVEEFQAYDKAEAALAEAGRVLAKASSESTGQTSSTESELSSVREQILLVRRHLETLQTYDQGDKAEALTAWRHLASKLQSQGGIITVLRLGDVYACLVRVYMDTGDLSAAHRIVEQLRLAYPAYNPSYFVGASTLSRIATGLGLSPDESSSSLNLESHQLEMENENTNNEVEEAIEEEVEPEPPEPPLAPAPPQINHHFPNGTATYIL